MSFDSRWQAVTCADCGRTYQCTPMDDFYHRPEVPEDERGPHNGLCAGCLLKPHGLKLGGVAIVSEDAP